MYLVKIEAICIQSSRLLLMSCFSCIKARVTSLEQLSVAEFSGEKARPKAYENDLKNVLAIWLDLELKVKDVKNLSF